jgi:hypothetical protein
MHIARFIVNLQGQRLTASPAAQHLNKQPARRLTRRDRRDQ